MITAETLRIAASTPDLLAKQAIEGLLRDAATEIDRLTSCLKKANEQAERFERHWYLAKQDADRYAFAKTLEGQIVTIDTFKNLGAGALDDALDEASADNA